MRVKKRIIGLFLVLAVILTLFPMSVSAAPSGRLEGVDYARVTAGKGYQVKLSLGKLEFWGELVRGTTLSEREQDEIIRKVMTDWAGKNDPRLNGGYLTSGVLSNMDLIAQGEKMESNLTREMLARTINGIIDVGSNFIDMPGGLAGDAGASAVKNALMGLLDYVITDKTMTPETLKQMAVDYTLGVTLDIGMDTKILKPLAKKLVKSDRRAKMIFAAKDLIIHGVGMKMKYDDMKEIINAGLDRVTLLNDFYLECNERIAAASGDNLQWRITFADPKGRGVTATHGFNMWGIGGLMSEWTLTGELVRQVTGAGDAFGGTYQGILQLEINGVDMKNSFDARFMDNDRFYNLDKQDWTIRGITPKDDYQTTVLKRTVSGAFTVYVPEASGEFAPTILGSLTNSSDKTEFSFDHHINGEGTFSSAGSNIAMTSSLKYMSNDIGSYTFVLEQYAGGMVSDYATNTIPQEPGTVWQPLESEPMMTVYTQ